MRRLHLARASRSVVLIVFVIGAFAAHARAAMANQQPSTGTVTGAVVDDTGVPIGAAVVKLTPDSGAVLEVATGPNGRFSLAGVPAGPYQLTVAAHGFAEQTLSGTVAPAEVSTLAEIRLRITTAAVSVDVTPSVVEVAEQQIKDQEQQRVFGFIPNFYVSFVPDAAPLNVRQKFQLSWKARTDPMQFAFVAAIAGVQQRRDDYPGFGDGVSGYAKRYAAAYGTVLTRSLITQALLPAVLRQDPRYFHKGTGSKKSRLLYAMSQSVVRKGDKGRWQPNYSDIFGSLASGAISNLYYPAEDRRGVRLTLQNTAIGVAGGAVGHIAQEFLYARITSRAHRRRDP